MLHHRCFPLRVGLSRVTFCSGLLLALTASCAQTGSARRGDLMIVGGGLQAENAEVLGAFLHGTGQRIIVLPTASGVPLKSGPGAVSDLELYASPDQSLGVLPILSDTPQHAQDAQYVRAIEEATGAWFTGGVQSRILAVFRPDGVDSPAYQAMVELLERGGMIGGSSAGAAMMCDPMIAWGNSREALLCGVHGDTEDQALGIEQGMGFFPFGLVDQHFLRRGRIGRLVVALEHTGQTLGFGIAENSALAVDLAKARGRVLGTRAVVVVNSAGSVQSGLSRRGLRVSLLSSGDEVDLKRGKVRVDPSKHAIQPSAEAIDSEGEALGPWDRYALSLLMERLARAPESEQRASDEVFSLVLRADSRTQFRASDEAWTHFTVIDAILDIEALPGAESAAEALKGELTSLDLAPNQP
ncbi:MAG: cyanophycinase [Paracoccaceae bacterium]|jgi:cyanophycinase